MPTTRQRRVQELLVQEISDIVRRDLKDPRVGFLTITDAEVTPDLRHARVYFTVLGDHTQREETEKALKRAAGFIRAEFARRAQMRFVPELRFDYDAALERGTRIHELLEQVRRDERQDDGAGSGSADRGGGHPPGE
jgi:ribosome-binding factor A